MSAAPSAWSSVAVLCGALGVSACGKVAGSGPDAGHEIDAAVDPAPDAAKPRCDPTADFGKADPLDSLNTDLDDEHAELSADELTIYFSSTRPGGMGGFDIYFATRPSISAPFGNITPAPGVNTPGNERTPRITADGLSLYSMTATSTAAALRISLATRPNTAVDFSELKPVANINGALDDADPYLVAGGNAMYLANDMTGNLDLYRTAKAGGAFATPTPVSGVDLVTTATENNPVVTVDELTMFFGSTRPGAVGGTGDFDIYQARRASVADGFGAAIPLTQLNTAGADVPNWVSPDGCHLYLTRAEPNVGYQLYMASRGP